MFFFHGLFIFRRRILWLLRVKPCLLRLLFILFKVFSYETDLVQKNPETYKHWFKNLYINLSVMLFVNDRVRTVRQMNGTLIFLKSILNVCTTRKSKVGNWSWIYMTDTYFLSCLFAQHIHENTLNTVYMYKKYLSDNFSIWIEEKRKIPI